MTEVVPTQIFACRSDDRLACSALDLLTAQGCTTVKLDILEGAIPSKQFLQDAVVLMTRSDGRFIGSVVRITPDDLENRKKNLTGRGFKFDDESWEMMAKRLVLLNPANTDEKKFKIAIKNMAGIKPPKRKSGKRPRMASRYTRSREQVMNGGCGFYADA